MFLLFSIFFGLGAGGFAYTKMGKRIGYGNSSSVWIVSGVAFLIGTVVFYTFLTTILGLSN
jgi:hypothetical protein